MTALAPIDIFRVANILGEGILWDWRRQLLCWTDIQGRRLYRHDWQHQTLKVFDTPERVGSFGLIAGSERLIAAFAGGIALYDLDQGTMVEGGQSIARGSLYSAAGIGPANFQLRGISISNGLCHSPDGAAVDVDGCIWGS